MRVEDGFSLVELSIVLVVIGVLASTAITPLKTIQLNARRTATQKQMESIRRSINAFIAAYGHVPCPAPLLDNVAVVDGSARSSAGSSCRHSAGGIPANELGLNGSRNLQGTLIDAWGLPIRYTVSAASSDLTGEVDVPDWTYPGEAANVGLTELTAELSVCHNATLASCRKQDQIATQLVWVALSTGENQAGSPAQSENLDGDDKFLHKPYSIADGDEFDDQLVWGSRHEVVFWLLRAGWLP